MSLRAFLTAVLGSSLVCVVACSSTVIHKVAADRAGDASAGEGEGEGEGDREGEGEPGAPGDGLDGGKKKDGGSSSSGGSSSGGSSSGGSSSGGSSSGGSSSGGPVIPVPSNVTCEKYYVSGSGMAIRVRWTDTASNETGFELARGAQGSSAYTYIGTAPANTTEAVDKNISLTAKYAYVLRTNTSAGSSSWSVPCNASACANDGESAYGTVCCAGLVQSGNKCWATTCEATPCTTSATCCGASPYCGSTGSVSLKCRSQQGLTGDGCAADADCGAVLKCVAHQCCKTVNAASNTPLECCSGQLDYVAGRCK